MQTTNEDLDTQKERTPDRGSFFVCFFAFSSEREFDDVTDSDIDAIDKCVKIHGIRSAFTAKCDS